MASNDYSYPTYAKILHLGLAVFGITAFLTGEWADNGASSPGYLLHAYLGLSLATAVSLRVLAGFAGPGPMRFSDWSPFSRRQWALAIQDVASLMQFRVPERGMHEGLAGLTQAFGLAIFAWMGASGTGLFLLGGMESEFFGKAHEVGEALIPFYLAVHVGSVVVHSLAGKPIWRRMWTFAKKTRLARSDESASGSASTIPR